MLDRTELGVVGQDRGIELLGGGNAECVSIGDSMFALNFGRCFDERLVHRKEINGKLLKKTKGFCGFGCAYPALDDVEELTPIDPVQNAPGMGLFLLVESRLHDLPAGFPTKKADQGEAIENEFFAHGGPFRDARAGDLWSGSIFP